MPHYPRQAAESQIYHVVARGNNQQDIFLDDRDFAKYRQYLLRVCSEHGLTLYAYCLMTNHVHLLIKEGDVALGKSIGIVNGSYARYLNWKNETSGHVFQDRFFSAPVEDDRYFLAALRYIHRNPLKAAMTNSLSYPWSSYDEYIDHAICVDTEMALSILGSVEEFIALHEAEQDALPEIREPGKKLTKLDAMHILLRCAGIAEVEELSELSTKEQAAALKKAHAYGVPVHWMKEMSGLSRRRLENLLSK